LKHDFAERQLFHSSGQTSLQIESIPLNFGGTNGPTHFLTIRSLYDTGYLTFNGSFKIAALRLRSAPTIVQLVDNQTGWGMEAVPLETAITLLRLKPNDIIPGSNCHGYAFAQSQFWIENDAVESLLNEPFIFERVDRATAHIAVFIDRGRAVHSCLVAHGNTGTRYVGKAGIGAIQETDEETEAARGNRYTHVEYYRRAS